MDPADASSLRRWVGQERATSDTITPGRARALAATLDREPGGLDPGALLPAGWHWAFFNPTPTRSRLGADGHEARGDFLPALPDARRMWAGGSLRFQGALRIGEAAERVSTIESVVPKRGRSGPLVFVTVRHRIGTRTGGTVIDERQDLVYRIAEPDADEADGSSADSPRAPTPGPGSARAGHGQPAGGDRRPTADWSERFVADEVTLFRFSALTFNGHRIHYDHPYATGTEGYPGLVVHGPLLALLLLDAGVRHARDRGVPGSHESEIGPGTAQAAGFRYRAVAPLFCNEPFDLCGGEPIAAAGGRTSVALWAQHPERGVATEAELELVRGAE